MTYVPGEDVNADRDFVQCQLISALFERDIEEGLALKGGFNMRVCHGSVRHTKDIDLAADVQMTMDRVKARVNAAVKRVKGLGIVRGLVVSTPKMTETTLRWKINGMIGNNDMQLTVEVRREKLPKDHLPIVTWRPSEVFGMPPARVKTFSSMAVAAAKVDCLSNPARFAPRDIYDLHVLITSQTIPPIELLRGMNQDRLRHGMTELWSKIDAMDYKMVKGELLPFLPPEAKAALTEDVWDEMRMTVGQHVEEWFRGVFPDEPSPGTKDQIEQRLA